MPGVDNKTIKRIAALEHRVTDLEFERDAIRKNLDMLRDINNVVKDTLNTHNYWTYREISTVTDAFCGECGHVDVIANPNNYICKKHNCPYGNSITRDTE
jgi:hypothetical protein